jgi:hypothetical protein
MKILGSFGDIDIEKSIEYILSYQTYEGGFAHEPSRHRCQSTPPASAGAPTDSPKFLTKAPSKSRFKWPLSAKNRR